MMRPIMIALLALLSGCSTVRVEGTAPASDPAAAWAAVLAQAVDAQGRVDFRALAARPQQLEAVIAAVAQGAPGSTTQEAIAFHLNAYNALAMYAVLRAGIPARLSLLGRVRFFKLTRVVVSGQAISLYDYENDVIRPLGDARVHFALNCMAVSCPILPRTPFTSAGLDAELDAAARRFFGETRNVAYDPQRNTVRFSAILRFYTEDFLRAAPGLVAYANRYRAEPIPVDATVTFIPYDWTINAQPAR